MRPYLSLITVLCLLGFAAAAQDKTVPPDVVKGISHKNDTVKTTEQKDLYDVFNSIFHKNKPKDTSPKQDSITSKPTFSVLPVAGYTLVSKAVVTLTGNAAFRMDSTARVSTITGYISYTQNKQFLLPIESDIWTKGNKFNLVGDFRFYKYPQSTFGLGSDSKMKDEDPMNYSYVRLYETVLAHISGNLYAGAGYIFDYHGRITHQGPLDGAPSDYTAYNSPGKTIATGYTLNGLYDDRDNSIYPEKGFYASVQFRDNERFLGSTSSWESLVVDVRKYFRLPANSDNVLALWSYDWLTLNGKPGYLDLPSNQWDAYSSTGRGYIQGRFRGAQEVYGETEYRFKITRNGLFGGVLFVNGQSYSAAQGTPLESIQFGYGPGLRIKINKLSKTNIAIDYGFGAQHSNGLFVNIGEVF